MALQSTESLHGFEDTGGDPAEHHLPSAPALHVPFDVPRAAEETLRRVGGGQRATQSGGEIEAQDGEGFFQAFPDARRGTGILGLQPPRQVLEQPVRHLEVDALIGATHDRLDPGALAIPEMVEDVAHLVHLTALHQRRLAEAGADGFPQRLRAIEDHQETAVRAQTAALEIGSSS
jgi:hypothetical protein